MVQTHGFEIESFGLTRDEIETAVETVEGVRYRGHFGYHGSRTLGRRWGTGTAENRGASGWVSEDDGSVHQRGYYGPSGDGIEHEIISPIMGGLAGIQEVKRVMKALMRAGAQVNSSCGLHYTIGTECNARFMRMSVKKRTMVIGRMLDCYDYFQPFAIDALVPVSRRAGSNGYCSMIAGGRYNNRFGVGNVESYTDAYRNYGIGRGVVNLGNFSHRGVIEFRQHGGTLNGFKIETWALLMHRIWSWAVNTSRMDGNIDLRSYDPTLHGMMDCLGLGVELRERVTCRAEETANVEETQYTCQRQTARADYLSFMSAQAPIGSRDEYLQASRDESEERAAERALSDLFADEEAA